MDAPAIRRLVPSDARAYRSLMLEAYARHPDAFTSSAEERAALPLSWWEARASEMVFGAFDAGQLVGAAGLSFETREKTRHKASLFGMYVAPAARQGGIGRQLVEAVLEHARQRGGIRLVQLTVSDGNDGARRLYERCGFVQFGLEPMAVALGNGFVAKVHMWCPL